jgi:hypothetical protein
MPKIDEAAKAWQKDMAERIGRAVQTRRRELKITAAALARRCAELGYPISRVAIGKIETNHREGKFDLAEWLVLAAALEIPPGLLLFPSYPHGHLKALPGRYTDSYYALKWLAGLLPPKRRLDGSIVGIPKANPGVELIDAVEDRAELDFDLSVLELRDRAKNRSPEVVESTRRVMDARKQELVETEAKIAAAKAALWGAMEGTVSR